MKMRLQEFFWTSSQYRWIRTWILASLFAFGSGALWAELGLGFWISTCLSSAMCALVVYLRGKEIL